MIADNESQQKFVTYSLTEEEVEFLKQLLDNPQLTVPVKLARVAGQVHYKFCGQPKT